MKKTRIILIFSFLFALCASSAYARINFIEQWKPGVDTGIISRGDYGLAVNMSVAADDSHEDTLSLPVIFTYSPAEYLELATGLGVISYGSETGISDLSLGMKYNFWKEDPATGQPSIAGEFGFLLPTADYRKNLGPGGVGINFNWILQKTVREVRGHLALGYEIHTENPDDSKPGNEIMWSVGAQYEYKKNLELYGALTGINHSPVKINGNAAPGSSFQELYLAPGLRYNNGRYDFYFSPLIGITDDSYNLIFFAGMEMKI